MRLGGWQRIGIVASVVWFFAGGFIGNKLAIDDAGAKTSSWFESCVGANKMKFGEYGPYEKVWTPCWNQYGPEYAKNAEWHWWMALGLALVPLPIAWLLGWLFITTSRWVARGFGKAQREVSQGASARERSAVSRTRPSPCRTPDGSGS